MNTTPILNVVRLPLAPSPDQAWQLALGALSAGHFGSALELFRTVACSGEWQGYFMMAVTRLHVDSGEDTVHLAVKDMECAARSNHLLAKFGLAVVLCEIRGEVERRRSLVIMQDCAAGGYAPAKILAGLLLIDDRHDPRCKELAISYWLQAAIDGWVWPMQLLAKQFFRDRRFLDALQWKLRAISTTFRLAKVDRTDDRLLFATS